MPETFTIGIEVKFEAAHNLRSYHGKPEPRHDHSWKVGARFVCKKLDHEGIAIDYLHIEKALRRLVSKFDHSYINDVPPFDKLNPTSENIAKWLFENLDTADVRKNSKLDEVIVWEGASAYVAYKKR